MRTTIDKAERVVIPASIRERAGLSPGSELEITEDELGVRLQRVAAGDERCAPIAVNRSDDRA
jgi:AbrB family looped-hinge helix DNA binding protein